MKLGYDKFLLVWSFYLLHIPAFVGVNEAQVTIDFVTTNSLNEPYGLAVSSEKRYYFTDSSNHRVMALDSGSGNLTTVAGVTGLSGRSVGLGLDVNSDKDIAGGIAKFFSPRGIALSNDEQSLYVADSGNHRILQIDISRSIATVTQLAGSDDGTPGSQADFQGALATARFNNPSDIQVDAQGRIYVADTKNDRIVRLDTATDTFEVLAEQATMNGEFSQPNSIAIADNGDIFVADTRNHAIKRIDITTDLVSTIVGSPLGLSGTSDSVFGDEALFSHPSGLVYVNETFGLLVADTGNHTLRRVFIDDDLNAIVAPATPIYSVELFAGIPTFPGFTNGDVLESLLNNPVGLAKDLDDSLLIADLGNNAIRRIQLSPPKPQVSDPIIGYVTFALNRDQQLVTKLAKIETEAQFSNERIIALFSEGQTETFYTSGATPNLLSEDTIPIPNADNSLSPPPYEDGILKDEFEGTSMIDLAADTTIKAVSTAEGRRPSNVVQARISYKVASPLINGDNPASFSFQSQTSEAEIWYTIDGSVPTQGAPSLGPVFSNEIVGLKTSDLPAEAEEVTIRAKGFRNNFTSSDISTKVLSTVNFQANRISFGFERGEASSSFKAAAGQTFIAPVTLSTLPDQAIYTLQFNITVDEEGAAPALTPGGFGFSSMLTQPSGPNTVAYIPPQVFNATSNVVDDVQFPNFDDLLVGNTSANLLGIGWIERITAGPLYNTVLQNLISTSQAHDTVFEAENQKTILGGYFFSVPSTAAQGDQYRITLGRPSATSDGLGDDVFIDTPNKGSLSAGALNSVKLVTVEEASYVVGDAAPFRWFNAGDFGDGELLSGDAVQVYQTAILGFNGPPSSTDFFDVMDSCCIGTDGVTDYSASNLLSGDDVDINDIAFGDGRLDLNDIFVTFRRSLDPTLTWYERYWEGGVRKSRVTDNLFRGLPNMPAQELSLRRDSISQQALETGDYRTRPSVHVHIPDLVGTPGQYVDAFIHADVEGELNIHTLLLNLEVQPLDNAPALTEPIITEFARELGASAMQHQDSNSYAAAWLSRHTQGVNGDQPLGRIRFRIPHEAKNEDVYRIHLERFSSSPNGIQIFPVSIENGLVSAGPLPDPVFQTTLPADWQMRHFGGANNLIAYPTEDPDLDGMSNEAEFRAKTDPTDAQSKLAVSRVEDDQEGVTLVWIAQPGVTYRIDSISSVTESGWAPVSSEITGTGHEVEYKVEKQAGLEFYRLVVTN